MGAVRGRGGRVSRGEGLGIVISQGGVPTPRRVDARTDRTRPRACDARSSWTERGTRGASRAWVRSARASSSSRPRKDGARRRSLDARVEQASRGRRSTEKTLVALQRLFLIDARMRGISTLGLGKLRWLEKSRTFPPNFFACTDRAVAFCGIFCRFPRRPTRARVPTRPRTTPRERSPAFGSPPTPLERSRVATRAFARARGASANRHFGKFPAAVAKSAWEFEK